MIVGHKTAIMWRRELEEMGTHCVTAMFALKEVDMENND